MPTVKVKANKMGGAQVSYISLVERGANRIPFKIIKQEKRMSGHFAGLDLGNLFTRKAEVDQEAQVVGIVTMKGDGFDSIKQQIEDAGFDVSDMQEMEDGSVVFKQDGEIEGDTSVVRLNDHVAIVTKGFSPYVMNMDVGEETSFADACAAQGFYPGVRTIVDVLASSINRVVEKADTPANAARAVSKMFDEAKAYTSSFMNGLPQKAFKLEDVAPELPGADDTPAKTDPETTETAAAAAPAGDAADDAETVEKAAKLVKPDSVDQAEWDKMAPADRVKACESADAAPAKKDDGAEAAPAAAAPATEAATSSLTEEQVSSIVATKMGEVVESFTQKLETALAAVTKSVQDSMASVGGSIADISARVSKAEEEAAKAKSAVTGTIVAGSEAGDHQPVARKSEPSGVYGGREIDTAFMPHVRKRASR